jgi:hypothetical protein
MYQHVTTVTTILFRGLIKKLRRPCAKGTLHQEIATKPSQTMTSQDGCFAYIGLVIYTPQKESALSIVHVPVQLYQERFLIHAQSSFIYERDLHVISTESNNMKVLFLNIH